MSGSLESAGSVESVESRVLDAPEVAPEDRSRGGMLAPFGVRDFRLLFAGQLISLIGDAFYAVALPWYMLTQGGGAQNLGLVLTAYGVPMGAATLLGGWLSDKLRARRVMLFADFIRTFIMAGMAWLTFTGGAPLLAGGRVAPLWSVAALAAALGLFDGLFMPASNAVTPEVLPDDQLQAANGLTYAIARGAQMIGPAVAGATVTHLGSPLSFAVDALTFVVSTVTLVFIRGQAQRGAPADTGAAQVEAQADAAPGANSLWRFALATPYFIILFVVMIVANLFSGAAEVAFPAMAHGPLHSDAQGFGFMLAASGAGGLAGGLLAGALGRYITRGATSLLFFVIQTGAIFALAFAPTIAVAVACMAGFGLFNGLGNVSFLTLAQRRLPRNLLGRVFGVFAFANLATFPLSVAAAGFGVARFGPQPVILIAGAVLGGAVLGGFLSRDMRNL